MVPALHRMTLPVVLPMTGKHLVVLDSVLMHATPEGGYPADWLIARSHRLAEPMLYRLPSSTRLVQTLCGL